MFSGPDEPRKPLVFPASSGWSAVRCEQVTTDDGRYLTRAACVELVAWDFSPGIRRVVGLTSDGPGVTPHRTGRLCSTLMQEMSELAAGCTFARAATAQVNSDAARCEPTVP